MLTIRSDPGVFRQDGIRDFADARYDVAMNRTWICMGLWCWLAAASAFPACGQNGADSALDVASGADPSIRGLIRVSGRHIDLATDAQSRQQAEEIVAALDAAVGQWERFWKLSRGTLDEWKLKAFVLRDREDFRRRNLVPPRTPDFHYGYAIGDTVWVVAQPSQYYTRHLLLHEAAHALAYKWFGGAGPAWYMEGTAEMLSTHRGTGGEVLINHLPRRRDEVPYWGRFKAIQSRRDTKEIPSLGGVMRLPGDLDGDAELYAWSWAAAMILYAYPEYRDAFHAAARNGGVESTEFNELIRRRLASQWPVLAARWRLMSRDLDYGFDWQRERVSLSTRDPLYRGQELTVDVSAARGWQSAGVRFPPGTKLSIKAEGTCTLAETTAPWTSHPGGITIRYVKGIPLGKLTACVVPNAFSKEDTEPALPIIPIGESAELVFREYAWLVLRVNDAIGEMADNFGGYRVQVQRAR